MCIRICTCVRPRVCEDAPCHCKRPCRWPGRGAQTPRLCLRELSSPLLPIVEIQCVLPARVLCSGGMRDGVWPGAAVHPGPWMAYNPKQLDGRWWMQTIKPPRITHMRGTHKYTRPSTNNQLFTTMSCNQNCVCIILVASRMLSRMLLYSLRFNVCVCHCFVAGVVLGHSMGMDRWYLLL